ncbi:adenosine receptor A2b-like [Dendronephthya gigantea]|uniref:adenosine receptor A2b-like n=1 Tax=Dendronephthya gigantea TaxID=151771 RepID=UPI0010699132|nr:adenosine receptor A2b-like [Dendronephthya gigantea]
MELSQNITASSNHSNRTEMLEDSKWLEFEAFKERLYLSMRDLVIFFTIPIILGNTLVLIVTWKERCLHQPSKYFIAFLAVADLLVGLFVALFFAYQLGLEYTRSDRDNMSIHPCFMLWIDTFALTTSIYLLTTIIFGRHLKISGSLLYKSRMTTSRSIKIIFVIVLISTAIATYSATPRSGSSGILGTGTGPCSYDADLEKSAIFFLGLTISVFFLSVLVIVIMYALIFHVAHKRDKMVVNGVLGEAINNQNQRAALRRDMKLIRILLVVVGVFLLCWGPLFTFILIEYLNIIDWDNNSLSFEYRMYVFMTIANILPFFNSLCNPIIYVCLDQTYQEAFKRISRRMTDASTKSAKTTAIELRPPRA